MKIRKMTATFGALDGAVLEPGEGLTVVSAPNESGKSTWAGFLKAMLYGIDTRERDKAGFLADKTRYQPWSGTPMSGEMRVEWRGKDLTIRRFPTRTNPFGGFEAAYTASGDPVPGLTAANAGEQLTGVGRETFLRSAFVGQGGAAISPSGELEARIAALAASGQEDVSFSETQRVLKDWRNRRRLNRSNGLIPQLEEEKSRLEGTLREMEQTRRRKAQAEEELARLEEKRRELQGDLELWARIEKHELNRRYGEAYREWEEAKAAIPEDRLHPVFGSMTGEEAWAFAQVRQKERDAAVEENRRREDRRREAERQNQRGRREILAWGGTLGLLGAILLLIFAVLPDRNWLLGALSCAAILADLLCTLHGAGMIRRARAQIKDCQPVPVPDDADWLSKAARYREDLAKADQARAAEKSARRRVDDLAAQGGRLFDTLEMLHPPAQSKAATAAQLAACERELARVRDELARAEGTLAHMGGAEELEDKKSGLEAQLACRYEEYDALTAALDALDAANSALRSRFSPALNQKAGELLAALTGGRWDRLTLARDFTAQAGNGEGPLPRPSLALSAGTAEQLYLAVRLALCQLTAPEAPLVLDDALAAFDDERMALALELLQTLGAERQILLFSCHGREARWAREHGVPALSLQ